MDKVVKILIVGNWYWPQYEKAFACALRDNGVEIIGLSTKRFFSGFFGRVQQKFPIPGSAMLGLNRAVIVEAKKHRPDFILFWRPTHIMPYTLRQLEILGISTISYNNDDPFGPTIYGNAPWHHHFLWYWYTRCLPLFQLNFFYRKINCGEALTQGAKHATVLLPYFMPWQDRPVQLTEEERGCYDTEVVFAGHYEPDGREESIRALVSAGLKVKLWGGHYWSRAVLGDLYDGLAPIVPAEGDDYAKALCGAKVCLCFLSKLNRDTYTRRCFEIPACGGLMLAERTDDLIRFFKEDEEACFFSSTAELLEKARWLIQNPQDRELIAASGLRRVWADGHDVYSRASWFIDTIENYLPN
jgi:spore maturation protein CgeB